MENERTEKNQDAMENEHAKEREYAKGKEYAVFPPIDPDIWIEISHLLPQGHMKKYWEDLASIKRLPKDDPIVVALLAMGIMTIVAREVPAELARSLANHQAFFTDDVFQRKVGFDLDKVKEECKAASKAFRVYQEGLSMTQRVEAEFRRRLDTLVEEKVAKEIAAKSFFDRNPLAIAYTAGGAMVVGFVLAYVYSHVW